MNMLSMNKNISKNVGLQTLLAQTVYLYWIVILN